MIVGALAKIQTEHHLNIGVQYITDGPTCSVFLLKKEVRI
jgi:hypothetical protein